MCKEQVRIFSTPCVTSCVNAYVHPPRSPNTPNTIEFITIYVLSRYFRNTTKGFQTMLSFFTSFTTVTLVVYSVAATLFQMFRMSKMDGIRGDFISKGFFCIAACLLVVMPVLSYANLQVRTVTIYRNSYIANNNI